MFIKPKLNKPPKFSPPGFSKSPPPKPGFPDIPKEEPPTFTEPQDDLVNIPGTDFFVTPNEARDPDYENPFTFSPLGIQIDVVQDDCNFGYQLQGQLAFMNLPAFQIVLRHPNCTPPLQQDIPLLPPIYQESPHYYGPPLDCSGYGVVAVYTSDYDRIETFDNFKGISANAIRRRIAHFSSININFPLYDGNELYAEVSLSSQEYYFDVQNLNDDGSIRNYIENITEYFGDSNDGTNLNLRPVDYGKFKISHKPTVNQYSGLLDNPQYIVRRTGRFTQYQLNAPMGFFNVYIGSGAIDFWTSNSRFGANTTIYSNRTFRQYPGGDTDTIKETIRVVCKDTERKIKPPPPPKKRKKKMECCDELLRRTALILKRIGTLPAQVPDNLTKPTPSQISISSLAEYFSWQTIQIDSLLGQFPFEINVEDSDLTQEGNQGQTIKIPNVAEALAELMTLALLIRSETDAGLNVGIRSLLESGQTKTIAQITHDLALANAEFLGYKLKQKTVDFPMSFTPGEEKLDKILKEKDDYKLKTYENKDPKDFNDHIIPLLEFAAMWKSQNFRKIGTGGTAEALLAILGRAGQVVKDMDDQKDPTKPNKEDFDQFVEQAEMGFITQPGIRDNINPYSKDLERRPRIREIGVDPDGAD